MGRLVAEVIRAAADGLAGETWRFEVPDTFGAGLALRLEHYSAWTRPTPQSRPRITDGRRYNSNEGSWTPGWRNDCASGRPWVPPIPEDVAAEAREAIVALVRALPVDAPSEADADTVRRRRRRIDL